MGVGARGDTPPFGVSFHAGLGVVEEAFLVHGLRVPFHQGVWVGGGVYGRGAMAASFRQGAGEKMGG